MAARMDATTPTTPVPHLTTAISGPLWELEKLLLTRQVEIESWFRHRWRESPPPFYGSVDLRNAGFKIAPVDANLFPSGFNNLNPAFTPLCVQAIQATLERFAPPPENILLVPESHTRNLHYLEHLKVLHGLLEQAGFKTRIGSLLPLEQLATETHGPAGHGLHFEPIERRGDRLRLADGYDPDLILLNNDLSAGRPEILEGLSQPLLPGLQAGWTNRSKTSHCHAYRLLAQEFAELLDMDPWLIDPLFRNCGEIDFMRREGEACLLQGLEWLFYRMRRKYKEYNLDARPFAVIKADMGTYGMGVMTVRSPQEVLELNRRQRTRMARVKEGRRVTSVVIQEGVATHETVGNPAKSAEPVVYMVGCCVVGGFYRVHAQRGAEDNLNTPGMQFEPLAFDDCCNTPNPSDPPDAHCNRFYSYGVIGRLALLAAAREPTASPTPPG